jgi:HEAT repeat protein
VADAVQELRDALEADDAEELNRIIRRRSREHFEILRGLLVPDRAVSPEERRKALYVLGRWGDPGVVPDIRRVLPDLGEGERIAAVAALGRLGTAAAAEAVADHAEDPSPQVRKAVVNALGRLDRPEARQVLRAIEERDRLAWIRDLAAKRAERR